MGYNLGEYHIIGVVVKLENRLDINIIGVFKALLIRHYNCLLLRPVDSATKKKKTIQLSSITCGFTYGSYKEEDRSPTCE